MLTANSWCHLAQIFLDRTKVSPLCSSLTKDDGTREPTETDRPAGQPASAKRKGSGVPSLAPIRAPALTILTAEPGLSLGAKGLAAYLLSRPPRVVTRTELFSATSDPMSLVDYAIRELESVGMIEKVASRGKGRPRDTGGIRLKIPSL
jgi:hypothetical protein